MVLAPTLKEVHMKNALNLNKTALAALAAKIGGSDVVREEITTDIVREEITTDARL